MSNKFTKKAENVLKKAVTFSGELGHTYIGSEHILMGLAAEHDSVSSKILTSHGIHLDDIRQSIIEISGRGVPGNVDSESMTPGAKNIIEQSAMIAKNSSGNFIGTEHLLLALTNNSDCVGAKILEFHKLSLQELKNELLAVTEASNVDKKSIDNSKNNKKNEIHGCPYMSEYGSDLTLAAKKGRLDPIIGRARETERLIQILSRRTKNNPCLIGEPGVGKTAVVEGLAQKIAAGEVPEMLKGKTIVTLDISLMIAGAKYRGEFEERLKNVMREATQNTDIMLFIDELHTIIGAGAAEGAVDAANIIKPALARGELQLIGATTISEYRKHIEKDPALERRFQSILVEEPSIDDTEKILFGLRKKYEDHHNLKISDEAIRSSILLSSRYINDRYLPDKAIDLIDEAASRLRINKYTVPPRLKEIEAHLNAIMQDKERAVISQNFERAAKLRNEELKIKKQYADEKIEWDKISEQSGLCVTSDDIADIVTQWTKIPVNKLMEDEGQRLLNLSDRLKSSVIGQDRATEAVANAIIRGRTGVSSHDRPIGSFLFVGPTGVGKTQLTKALATEIFGSKDAILRFDMSEYMEKHSVSKLIGSPPGYIGYGEGGLLTEKIRQKPYSVVLFDEIEKADPDIFNLLLQVLDEGKLTDSCGREAIFKNSVLIMTSNVGSEISDESKKIGFSGITSQKTEHVKAINNKKKIEMLKKVFRPEFLNRIDEIVIFEKLTTDDIKKIASLFLDDFSARIAQKGITVQVDASAINVIAENGYDEEYGARPLKRAITTMVEDKFAFMILSNDAKSGSTFKMVGKKNINGNGYIEFECCE